MSEQKTNIDCPNYLICKQSVNHELYNCYNQKYRSCDEGEGEECVIELKCPLCRAK